MIEEYIELPFPADAEFFSDLAIYIRKGRMNREKTGQALAEVVDDHSRTIAS
jgi:hypothetical protein